MGKNEEKALINQIKYYKLQLRDLLKENFLREREDRHNKEEAFFKGLWIPRNKIELIQNKLKKMGLVIFLEIHVFIIIFLLFNYLIWIGFKIFLLP
jgi:hypothetical protein